MFFDGEGNIAYTGQNRRYLTVSVSQVDPSPLLWLRALFGGSVRKHSNRYNGIHVWRINGREAAKFLEAIYPYLLVKDQDAQDALARYGFSHESLRESKSESLS